MPQPLSVRWIAFDAVETLIFPDPPVHLAYFRIGRKYGSRLRPEEIRLRFRQAFHECASDAATPVAGVLEAPREVAVQGEAAARACWRRIAAAVLPDVADADACFEELFAHFANPGSWQCFADVEETLSAARQRGLHVAIASNFDARLHALCDGLAELASIERRVISSEVGCAKPSPAFYEALLAACECEPAELLMVGDDLENDILAPRRLGIHAVQIDRSTDGSGAALRSLTELWRAL